MYQRKVADKTEMKKIGKIAQRTISRYFYLFILDISVPYTFVKAKKNEVDGDCVQPFDWNGKNEKNGRRNIAREKKPKILYKYKAKVNSKANNPLEMNTFSQKRSPRHDTHTQRESFSYIHLKNPTTTARQKNGSRRSKNSQKINTRRKWENEKMKCFRESTGWTVVLSTENKQTNTKNTKKKHEIVEAKRLYLHKNKIEKENINANE